MIKRNLFLVFLIGLLSSPLAAQSFDSAIEQVKTSFNKGDFSNLSNLFSESVDLTVLNTEGIFSNAQAKGVLKTFFENDKPKSFQVKHQGSSNDGTRYAIGLYVSSKGSYRVYVLLKNKQENVKIVQLQIEEEL